MTRPRVLIHVHHLLGTGHLRRALALGRALSAAGAQAHVASGGLPVPGLSTAGVRFHQLSPARAADAAFKALLDAKGNRVDDTWRALRRAETLSLFKTVEPDALVFELYPFGRRLLRFELEPLVETALKRVKRPVIASSLRDILHPPRPERVEDIVGVVRRDFDLVLVHGDPSFVGLEASFPAAARIADRVVYTGYILEQPAAAELPGTPEVIVSAGGGIMGEPLFRAALAARPLSRYAHVPWRVIAGPTLPEEKFRAIAAEAPAEVTVERFRADLAGLLPRALCSVSQAGYNTVVEVLAARVPAVMVPFADGGEVEQTIRCRVLAEKGFIGWVRPEELSPRALARAIDAARPPVGPPPAMHGAAEAAAALLREVARRT